MAANPFLTSDMPTGQASISQEPAGYMPVAGNHPGHFSEFQNAHLHVAAILLLSLFVLAAMKASGFRAMVGIGRN